MEKFKVYRNIAFLTVLAGLISMFSPYVLPASLMDMFSMFTMFSGLLLFVCYGLLVSIFNFYDDPLWKKLSIWLFILGTVLFNSVITLYYGESEWIDFILLLFYTPLIVAFITVRHEGIKPFAQSFGYTLLIVCFLRIGLPFIRDSAYFPIYANAFGVVYILPVALIAALFHKMRGVLKRNDEEDAKSEGDLL